MCWNLIKYLAISLVVCLVAPAAAEDNEMRLCPVELRLSLDVDIDAPGATGELRQSRIRRLMREKLRDADIYDNDAEPELFVQISAGEPDEESHFPFYAIDVEYWRYMVYPDRDWESFVPIWSIGSIGQGSADFITKHTTRLVEEFIAEYERVLNTEECREFRESH